MTMIALGGVIGAGLFVGSGVVIQSAGPAAVLSFVLTGLLVVLVMRMLGEMAVALPAVGSFYEYARLAFARPSGARRSRRLSDRLDVLVLLGDRRRARGGRRRRIGPLLAARSAALAGEPRVAGRADAHRICSRCAATASSSSGSPRSRWSRSSAFLLVGGPVRARPLAGRRRGTVRNLTAQRRLRAERHAAVLTGAVATTGFYFGAEIVTVAAAEAAEPAKAVADAAQLGDLPRAVLLRGLGPAGRLPGAVELARHRHALRRALSRPWAFTAAAQIMNAVVLTAVLSALNSGLYASSRMLFALTRRGDAPHALAKLSRNGVPTRAILLGTAVRLRRRGHVLRFARYRVRVPGQFLRHRGHLRLCADRRCRSCGCAPGWSEKRPSGCGCACGAIPI